MIRCNSIIKINTQRLRELSQAQVTALEKTAEALHTEVVQAQVMPFDTGNLQNDIRLWITPTAKQDAQGLYLQRHMPEGYIFIRNTISRHMKIRLQAVNGLILGFQADCMKILHKKHLRNCTEGRVAYDFASRCERLAENSI